MAIEPDYEFVIIGSGFGGGAMSARLARRWPGRGLLLERGRDYPLGGFARSTAELADNFWAPEEEIARPRQVHRRRLAGSRLIGLFDVRRFGRMDTVTAAGLGGGSLIYANVFLRPAPEVFAAGWPAGLDRAALAPYYDVAQSVLGARALPPAAGEHDRRHLRRTGEFARFAAEQGLVSRPAEIAVFFGHGYSYNGAAAPAEMGVQETNRYGARQTSCTYCGECDLGCNVRAKNTTDLNYIHVAREKHGLALRTLCRAGRIVPLDAGGRDDPAGDGSHGYRVEFDDLAAGRVQSVTARRVVVSAGTLGSNELLLRCRDVHRSLPALSPALGRRFSGNGDFLAFALDGETQMDSTRGPVITQYTDHHLFERIDPERAFILEDASIPTHAAWAMAAARPAIEPWDSFVQFVRSAFRYLTGRAAGQASQRLGGALNELLGNDLTQRSAVLLCMGRDRGDGRFSLNPAGWLDLDWPQSTSLPLYQAILALNRRFAKFIGARIFLPLPTWLAGRNVTVHPLGGCALADTPEQGVVSARAGERGQVFGYRGLYVADGSLMPTALGANPAATITALAEWIAHDLTGLAPDDTLA